MNFVDAEGVIYVQSNPLEFDRFNSIEFGGISRPPPTND